MNPKKKPSKTCLRRTAAFLLLALLLSLCACRNADLHTLRLYGMGTFCAFTVESAKEGTDDASFALKSALSETEGLLSHRIEGSLPDLLSKNGFLSFAEERVILALRLAEDVKRKTDGRFSVSVLPLTRLWNFDAETPLPPDASQIAAALEEIKGSALFFEEGGGIRAVGGALDLGALGKGYACDVLAEILRSRGESGLISVGGSIAAVESKGGKPWTVGVRDPFSASQNDTVGVLSLTDAYVSTSGSYEKTFTYDGVQYHHILDPVTGMPAESDLVSVTVVAPSGVLSDILSTACFLVGGEEAFSLAADYGASLIAVTKDGKMLVSEGLRSSFKATFSGEVLYR